MRARVGVGRHSVFTSGGLESPDCHAAGHRIFAVREDGWRNTLRSVEDCAGEAERDGIIRIPALWVDGAVETAHSLDLFGLFA